MKALFKACFTYLLSFFNIGLYQLGDSMDSLVLDLYRNGVEEQANELIKLYQAVEYHQGILILLDSVKCLLMLLSLLFLLLLHYPKIMASLKGFYHKAQQAYHYLCKLFA